MASGAGLNRVGQKGGIPILTTSAASATSPLFMNDAMGFSKWSFQLLGTFTNYSVVIQGTIDPIVFDLVEQYNKGIDPTALTKVPTTSWFNIVAPATEGGETAPDDTSQFFNPLTATGQCLYTSMPLVAVRAVATGSTQTGTVTVVGFAIP